MDRTFRLDKGSSSLYCKTQKEGKKEVPHCCIIIIIIIIVLVAVLVRQGVPQQANVIPEWKLRQEFLLDVVVSTVISRTDSYGLTRALHDGITLLLL